MANGAQQRPGVLDPRIGALLAFGSGLGQAAGPSPVPVGLGAALGQAGMQGLGTYQALTQQQGQQQAQTQQNELRQLEMELKRAEMDRKTRQDQRRKEAIQRYMQGRSPEERALIEAAPDKALGAMVDQQFAEPDAPKVFGSAKTGYFALDSSSGEARPLVEAVSPGAAEATTAIKTREHKINEYMDLFGLGQQEATLRVDKGYDLVTTSDGRLLERHPITHETKDVTPPRQQFTLPGQEQGSDTREAGQQVAPAQGQAQAQTEPRTLWNLADESPGIVRSAEEFTSAVSGQVGGPIAEETIDARQAFRTAMGELRRSLSINKRYPVGEMQRIEEEIKIMPSAWDNPEDLRTRMKSIDKSLQRRIDNEVAAANNPFFSQEERAAAAQAAKNLHNFRQLMGVPQGGQRAEAPQQAGEQGAEGTGLPTPGDVVDGYRFKGGNPNDPSSWVQVQ